MRERRSSIIAPSVSTCSAPRPLASACFLSASSFSTDEEHLATQMSLLEAACAAARSTLILGGSGAWPDRASDARRVTSFRQLLRVAQELAED